MDDDYTPSADSVLIRCASHRARQALQRRSPQPLESYFSWDTACTGGFVRVPRALLGDALLITGCTKASPQFRYHRCR